MGSIGYILENGGYGGRLPGTAASGPGERQTVVLNGLAAAERASSVDRLLESPADLIALGTAVGHHAEYAIKVLQKGKAVVVEGALCLTTAAAWQMLETARYCKRPLLPLSPLRYRTTVAQARETILDGRIGTVQQFSLRCSLAGRQQRARFPDGGLLYAFYEAVELLLSLVGPVEAKAAAIAAPSETTEQQGAALLQQGQACGTLQWQQGWLEETVLTIEGTEGRLVLEGRELERLTFSNGKASAVLTDERERPELLQLFYKDLPSALEGSAVTGASLMEAVAAVSLIDRIYQLANLSSRD